MCQYISVVVPDTVHVEGIEAWAHAHHLGFSRYDNPHLGAQLQPREVLALATSRGCDCGSVVGAASRSSDDGAKLEGRARRMRKLGWSAAKIRRALEQTAAAAKKPKGSVVRGVAGLEEWAGFLRGVRAHGGIARIGVVWHVYRGSIVGEDFRFTRAPRRSALDLTPDDLARLPENVLYDLVVPR